MYDFRRARYFLMDDKSIERQRQRQPPRITHPPSTSITTPLAFEVPFRFVLSTSVVRQTNTRTSTDEKLSTGLVFDNVDYSTRQSPELLSELRQVAKEAVDSFDVTDGLVCSEGWVRIQLFGM